MRLSHLTLAACSLVVDAPDLFTATLLSLLQVLDGLLTGVPIGAAWYTDPGFTEGLAMHAQTAVLGVCLMEAMSFACRIYKI